MCVLFDMLMLSPRSVMGKFLDLSTLWLIANKHPQYFPIRYGTLHSTLTISRRPYLLL